MTASKFYAFSEQLPPISVEVAGWHHACGKRAPITNSFATPACAQAQHLCRNSRHVRGVPAHACQRHAGTYIHMYLYIRIWKVRLVDGDKRHTSSIYTLHMYCIYSIQVYIYTYTHKYSHMHFSNSNDLATHSLDAVGIYECIRICLCHKMKNGKILLHSSLPRANQPQNACECAKFSCHFLGN